MVHIAPIKYDKKEDAILARSLILGILVGVPLGIIINYLFGFPSLHRQAPISSDILGWAITLFLFFGSLSIVPFAATSLFLAVLLNNEGNLSVQHFSRTLWAPIVFLILLPFYVSVTSAILVPFNFVVHSFALWALVVTPFVFIFLVIFTPESRAGRNVRRLILRLREIISRG